MVNRASQSEMLITLNSDDEPDWLRDGNVGVQLMFDENAYLEMERALNIVMNPQDDRLLFLRSVLLESEEPTFTGKHQVQLPQLNASQNKALNLIASAMIWQSFTDLPEREKQPPWSKVFIIP